MNILKIKKLVHKILEEHPMARDNDNILVGLVWHYQLNQIGYRGDRVFSDHIRDR